MALRDVARSVSRAVSCVLHWYLDFALTHDRSSPEQSTDDDMNSTTTLKRCFLATGQAVGRHSTASIFSSDIRNDSKSNLHRPRQQPDHDSDLEHQLETQSSHGRQMTHQSAPVDASMPMPPASMASPQTTGARTSGGLSIGSLVNHPQGEYHRYNMGTPSFTGFSRPVLQYANGFTSSDDSIFYTPESSQSPVSEQYGRYPHRQSISSSSSVAGFEAQASPMINGAAQWIPSSAPPNVLPPNMFEEHSYMTVGDLFDSLSTCCIFTEADQTNADSSLPIPLTNLDGDEFDIIRRELSYAPGILSNPDGAPVPDAIRWDCLEHYWQNFHPYFPVVHRPTFLPTKPSPLLASAMVAIGSQFDQRSDAKQYSLTLLEVATRLLRRRDSITSRSRLADLQTVFLLEVLSKYFARRIEVDMSARFRALFASLDQAKRTLSTSPLAVFKTLRPNYTKEDLTKAHKFWIDHETRRRVLQAFAILDMQQILFFEQPATIVQHPRTRLNTGTAKTSMSLPCEQELWETSPIDEWKGFAADHKNLEASKVGQSPSQGGDRKLDYFQMQTSLQADPYALHRFCFEDEDASLASVVDGTPRASMSFNHHAMAFAKQTPIKTLLIVSAESWVFGKKLESEAEFQAARQRLRNWVNTGTDSVAALWHAIALLRKQIMFTASDTNPQEIVASFRTTRMLHEPWCVYLATLVVWAHGLYPSLSYNTGDQRSRAASVTSAANSNRSHQSSRSSSSGHPSLMDSNDAAQEAQTYLQATDVATPVELTHVDPALLGRIHGLLEVVRMQKILPLMGGLMNEAERVLFRLVEGRSSLSHF